MSFRLTEFLPAEERVGPRGGALAIGAGQGRAAGGGRQPIGLQRAVTNLIQVWLRRR